MKLKKLLIVMMLMISPLLSTDFESALKNIKITNKYQGADYFGLPYTVLEVEGKFYFAYEFQEFRDIQYFMAELDMRKDQLEQIKFLKDAFEDFQGTGADLVENLERKNRRKFWRGFATGTAATIGTGAVIFIIYSIKNLPKKR